MNPRIPDPQASPPTCDQCGAEVNVGYYDSRGEQYYCSDGCFEDWADSHFDEVVEFYRRINLD